MSVRWFVVFGWALLTADLAWGSRPPRPQLDPEDGRNRTCSTTLAPHYHGDVDVWLSPPRHHLPVRFDVTVLSVLAPKRQVWAGILPPVDRRYESPPTWYSPGECDRPRIANTWPDVRHRDYGPHRAHILRVGPVDEVGRRGPGLRVAVTDAGFVPGFGIRTAAVTFLGALVSIAALAATWGFGRRPRPSTEMPDPRSVAGWMLDGALGVLAGVVGRSLGAPLAIAAAAMAPDRWSRGRSLQELHQVFAKVDLLDEMALPALGLVATAAIFMVGSAPIARWAAADLWHRVHPLAALFAGPVLCGLAGAAFAGVLGFGSFVPSLTLLTGYFAYGALYGALPWAMYVLLRFRGRATWPVHVLVLVETALLAAPMGAGLL